MKTHAPLLLESLQTLKWSSLFFKDWPVDCVQRCRPMTHIGYDVTDGYINLRYWHWLYPMVDVIREKVNAERLTVGQITD